MRFILGRKQEHRAREWWWAAPSGNLHLLKKTNKVRGVATRHIGSRRVNLGSGPVLGNSELEISTH